MNFEILSSEVWGIKVTASLNFEDGSDPIEVTLTFAGLTEDAEIKLGFANEAVCILRQRAKDAQTEFDEGGVERMRDGFLEEIEAQDVDLSPSMALMQKVDAGGVVKELKR